MGQLQSAGKRTGRMEDKLVKAYYHSGHRAAAAAAVQPRCGRNEPASLPLINLINALTVDFNSRALAWTF